MKTKQECRPFNHKTCRSHTSCCCNDNGLKEGRIEAYKKCLELIKNLTREEDNGPDAFSGMDIVETNHLVEEIEKELNEIQEKNP